jgi:putative ABC transport system ATP-binding protein
VQGPSGCGKTTLLLAVGALLQPDTGRVLVDGEDLYAMPLERRAQFRATTIGFVFQQFHLIPYLSVRDNVLAPTLALAAGDATDARRGVAGAVQS